jgi:hypothetical protein
MGRPPTELRPYAHSAPRQPPIDPEAAAQRTARAMIAAYAKATGDTEEAPPPLTGVAAAMVAAYRKAQGDAL